MCYNEQACPAVATVPVCCRVYVCVCVSETETQAGDSGTVRDRHREGDQSDWVSTFRFRLRVKGKGFRVFRVLGFGRLRPVKVDISVCQYYNTLTQETRGVLHGVAIRQPIPLHILHHLVSFSVCELGEIHGHLSQVQGLGFRV